MTFSDPLFQIGSFPIYVFGLSLALTFVLSVFLFWRAATKEGFASDSVFDLIFLTVFAALLGGRLFYLGVNGGLGILWSDPLVLVRVGEGIYWAPAFVGGLAAFYLLIKRRSKSGGWSFLKLADLAAPVIALAYGLGFLAGGATGYISFISVNHSVPLLAYLAAAFAILFVVLELVKKKAKVNGFAFFLYLILFGLTTYFLTYITTSHAYAFRADINALSGILMAIGGVLGFLHLHRGRIEAWFKPLRRRLEALPFFGRVEKQLKFKLRIRKKGNRVLAGTWRGSESAFARDEEMIKNICKLPINFLRKVKSFLESEAKRLAEEEEKLEKEDPFRVPGRDVGNPEMVEEATEKIGHEQVQAQKGIFHRLLIDTRWALSKLKIGKYGVCDECSECIDRARLRVFPQARRCVKCDEKVREKEAAAGGSE